ncbi:hypothetical protein WG68_10795 [Arsukibacterium ikkense]|uniref:Uncharacterized protein n=1 Tax=Arsukibacterium ikkense TaxID=336831 RepID=A0A0M2V3T3_9GAMM|nr:hypothetical protein [Arsukibacterium ikkense]KKO45517.1 hypothetical protein WG68_10795 [Arsukibacterium ikkense]
MLVNTGTFNSFSSNANSNVSNSAAAAAPLLAETNSRQRSLDAATATATPDVTRPRQQAAEPSSESVRVSSTIGLAASAGQLTREQALEIYRNIARFL